MWPEDLERVQKYNRVSHSAYVSWLLARVDMPMRPSYLALRTREDVDMAILGAIEVGPVETPNWVEAAKEVLSPTDVEVEEPEVTDLQPPEDEPAPVAPQDNPFSATDYDSWTVAELREECRARGITVRGTKAEVVLRLRRDDEGLTQDPVEPDNDESDAPADEAAATEDVTTDADSGETSDIEEEE